MPCCDCEDDNMKHNWDQAPHRVEGSPTGFACYPRDARVKLVRVKAVTIFSPADDQPPPRQEGEAGAIPCLRQIRDGAVVGGRAREQLHARELHITTTITANHHLP